MNALSPHTLTHTHKECVCVYVCERKGQEYESFLENAYWVYYFCKVHQQYQILGYCWWY